ncbi:hypothetical protein BC833DRAFT_595325, partial [Globomyces pollinis-pini]
MIDSYGCYLPQVFLWDSQDYYTNLQLQLLYKTDILPPVTLASTLADTENQIKLSQPKPATCSIDELQLLKSSTKSLLSEAEVYLANHVTPVAFQIAFEDQRYCWMNMGQILEEQERFQDIDLEPIHLPTDMSIEENRVQLKDVLLDITFTTQSAMDQLKLLLFQNRERLEHYHSTPKPKSPFKRFKKFMSKLFRFRFRR